MEGKVVKRTPKARNKAGSFCLRHRLASVAPSALPLPPHFSHSPNSNSQENNPEQPPSDHRNKPCDTRGRLPGPFRGCENVPGVRPFMPRQVSPGARAEAASLLGTAGTALAVKGARSRHMPLANPTRLHAEPVRPAASDILTPG